MSTAHDILHEVKYREVEEQTWLRLVRECRSTKWLSVVWVGMFTFFAWVGDLLVHRQAESASVFYFAPVAFLGITSPMIFIGQVLRENVPGYRLAGSEMVPLRWECIPVVVLLLLIVGGEFLLA